MGACKEYPVIVRNDNGQEVYREEINGHWVKREYDEKGRQVYWETSSGEWARHRFDDAGNTVWYENSDGYSFVAEYSQNGFRTYYEDSNGKVFGTKSVDGVIAEAKTRMGTDFSVDRKRSLDFSKGNGMEL